MCTLARSLIGGLLLILRGCAAIHPVVPAEALSQRILPPPDSAMLPQQTPEAPETLPPPRPLPPEEGAALDSSAPSIPPSSPIPWAERGALTLEEAMELARRSNPTLEAMRER